MEAKFLYFSTVKRNDDWLSFVQPLIQVHYDGMSLILFAPTKPCKLSFCLVDLPFTILMLYYFWVDIAMLGNGIDSKIFMLNLRCVPIIVTPPASIMLLEWLVHRKL